MNVFFFWEQRNFLNQVVIVLLFNLWEILKIQVLETQVILFSYFFSFNNPFFSNKIKDGIIKRTIVAIDATDYSKLEINSQYSKKNFERELNKAYIGFHPLEDEKETLAPVSTGDWVCVN